MVVLVAVWMVVGVATVTEYVTMLSMATTTSVGVGIKRAGEKVRGSFRKMIDAGRHQE
jgi:hypothetical protein